MNTRLAFAVALILAASPTAADATQPFKRGGSLSVASLRSCTAADLSLSFVGEQDGLGHGVLGFLLTNTSSISCTTRGYPRVLFLDKVNNPLPTTPAYTTHDFVAAAPLRRLTVAPRAAVSFRLIITHNLTSASVCPIAYGLRMIPPHDTASLRTSLPTGIYECQPTTVSPLQAGKSAYPK